MYHSHLDYFQKPSLGGRPNTKWRDHDTPNAHNRWFILVYHVWGPKWIEIHWNSIWLRARSHMTSHYTWGSVTTLRAIGGVLGRPLDTVFSLGFHNFTVMALRHVWLIIIQLGKLCPVWRRQGGWEIKPHHGSIHIVRRSVGGARREGALLISLSHSIRMCPSH